MWGKLKKVLGILTDVLTYGRGRGWWSRRGGPYAPDQKRSKDPSIDEKTIRP